MNNNRLDASPEWENTSLARLWSRGGGAGGDSDGLLLAAGGLVGHAVAPLVGDHVAAGVRPCGAPGLGGVSVGALVVLNILNRYVINIF